jgi:hypothetical protein
MNELQRNIKVPQQLEFLQRLSRTVLQPIGNTNRWFPAKKHAFHGSPSTARFGLQLQLSVPYQAKIEKKPALAWMAEKYLGPDFELETIKTSSLSLLFFRVTRPAY